MISHQETRLPASLRVAATGLVAIALVATLALMNAGSARGQGIIYDNTDSLGESVTIPGIPVGNPQAPQRIVDWSISPGGTVESFEIGYTSTQAGSVSLDVIFFDGANQQNDGFEIVTFELDNLPGSSNPPQRQELFQTIDTSGNPFVIPEGPFGYGFDLQDDDTGIIFAEGDPFGVDQYRVVIQNFNFNVNTPGVHDQLYMGINGNVTPSTGTVAYVSHSAEGPGALNDDTMPFPNITAALVAGASELRIEPGEYDGSVFVGFPADSKKFRTWNGQAGDSNQIDIVGTIGVAGGMENLSHQLDFGPGFNLSVAGTFINAGRITTQGASVVVGGSYLQGSNGGVDPGDALFSLAIDGIHTVVGDFTVGPDADPQSEDEADRNRYLLGGNDLDLFGDYTFLGTGDRFDDTVLDAAEQGLDGDVNFLGDSPQQLRHRQDEDAFFNDVMMNGPGGVQLQDHAWQNATGELTLEHGIIDTNSEQFDWIILNPGIEEDLVGRNNSAIGKGVVQLGSRDSYINGEVQRVVEAGNATGGVITGGYLFPVGATGNEEVGEPPEVDFFRPLILQFPDDLGQASIARVDYRQDLRNDNVEFPESGIPVPDIGGGDIELDTVGNQFWRLDFDRIPTFNPNIRVEADGLPNVFDITKLRLVQWDCDGTNPRLAGLYTLGDEDSAVVNDHIEGVPNLTQVEVTVEECNIIGIATDGAVNQIDEPPPKQHTQGDIQCDDDVDAVDALQLLLEAAGVEYQQEGDCVIIGGPLNPPGSVAHPAGEPPDIFGDVDCDGDVDAVDALKILQFVAAIPFTQSEPCVDIGDPF